MAKSHLELVREKGIVIIAPKQERTLGASVGVLTSRLVYQYGGPETKTECDHTRVISDNPITGKIIICDHYTSYIMQHAFYIDWYSPNVENANDQIKNIANSCLVSGVTLAVGATVLAPPTILTFLNESLNTIALGVRACIEATKLGGMLAGIEVDLRPRIESYWQAF